MNENESKRIFEFKDNFPWNIEWDQIIKRDLGDLGFTEVESLLREAHEILSSNSRYLDTAPRGARNAFLNLGDTFRKVTKDLHELDYKDTNFSEKRINLVVNTKTVLEQSIEAFKDSSWHFRFCELPSNEYVPDLKKLEVERLIDEIKENKSNTDSLVQDTETLLNSIRERAAKEILFTAKPLKSMFDGHLLTTIIFLALCIVTMRSAFFHIVNADYTLLKSEILPIRLIKLYGGPSVLMLASLISLKISFSSYHNFLIRQHKRFIINNYKLVIDSIRNPNTQDLAVITILREITGHQPTGFVKAPVESNVLPSQLQDIIKHIET